MQRSFLFKRLLTLLALSFVLFFLGNDLISLTEPDEVFYSLTAREMGQKGEWMTPYIFNKPQFEKPILTYWLLRVAFDIFGESPFSARFFPALFAMFGVLAVYALGTLGFRDERKGFWSALVLCSGALYTGMAKTVFTDMIFSVFILYAFLCFYLAFSIPRRKVAGILGFYFFAAMAVLTKGPLGLVIPGLSVALFLLYRRQIKFLCDRWFVIGLLLCMALALPWYEAMYRQYGQAFIQEFFYNDHWRRLVEAEHRASDRWYFYPLTMVAGFFPWSLFVLFALYDLFKKLKWGAGEFEYLLLSWLLVVLVIFQSAHSKLASYIMPLFPALALLTGGFIASRISLPKDRAIKVGVWVVLVIVGVFGIALVPAYHAYKAYISSVVPVYFLSALLVMWSGAGIVLMLKEKLSSALAVLSLCLLPFLFTLFFIKTDLEPYGSSYMLSQYLPHAPGQKTVILSSKAYARGVRYYTGQDVAVLDMDGSNYFSPHPIPILTTVEQLKVFLAARPVTYALIKKWHSGPLDKLSQEGFKVSEVKSLGYNYVLKIETLPHS